LLLRLPLSAPLVIPEGNLRLPLPWPTLLFVIQEGICFFLCPCLSSPNRALHAFLAIHEQVQSAATRPRTRRRAANSPSSELDPRVGTRAQPVSG